MQREYCPNNNHGRPVVTVRCCPNCGEIVNKKIPSRCCSDEEHAQRRRAQHSFCIHCGEQLAQAALGR